MKGVVYLPSEYLEDMKVLTDEQFGRLVRAILLYASTGDVPELPGAERHFIDYVRRVEDDIHNGDRKVFVRDIEKRQRKGSKALRFDILARDRFTCQYCGAKAPDVQLRVDHIYPFSKGGEDSPENLITSCFDCNAGKSAIILPRDLLEEKKIAIKDREG